MLPLTEDEIEAMHALLLARAAVCAVSSESQAQLAPDNAYVQEMLDGEWGLLDAAEAMPEVVATAAWRAACGLDPRPRDVASVALPTGGPLARGSTSGRSSRSTSHRSVTTCASTSPTAHAVRCVRSMRPRRAGCRSAATASPG